MLLIENGDVYGPDHRGTVSILIASGRIAHVGLLDGRALAASGVEVETIDASGCVVVPGLVDPHIHLIGGSGEEGFATLTPEIAATELWSSGITTVVGTLGTDTTTRTMAALLAKAKGLRQEGFAAWVWTGGYDARPLTGSVRDDIVLLDEVIGAGELAIADRRAVPFDARELARLATDCYVAGTLTGKAGILHLHVGPAEQRLDILREVIETHGIDPSVLYPTHVERNEALMREAFELTRRGMTIDVDVYEEDFVRWARYYRDRGGNPARLTASTDAAINAPRTLLQQVCACVREDVLGIDDAFRLVTSNTASVLKLHDSGSIAAGKRGDLLILRERGLELRDVVCSGQLVVRDGTLTRHEKYLEKSNREVHLAGRKGRRNEQ